MVKKFLFWTVFIYLVVGFAWLVAGTWLLNSLERNHPDADLRYLWDVKNIIFLFSNAIGIIYLINTYYKRLLLKERILNHELQKGKDELGELINTYEVVTLATNDVIWDYDIIKDELKWLNGYEEVFGYQDKVVVRDSIWNMQKVHEDDRDTVIRTFKKFIAGKEHQWSAEYRYQCKDGSYKYVFDRGYLVFNKDNEPIRVIGAMQDVTARKVYREQLEEQNAKLKDIAWLNSHEIRRPLCNITGLIPLIKNSTDDPEALLKLINLLETSSNQLDEITTKINDQVT